MDGVSGCPRSGQLTRDSVCLFVYWQIGMHCVGSREAGVVREGCVCGREAVATGCNGVHEDKYCDWQG